ncbi:MAG: hypothetical protein EA381_02705 [Planctomycetaceae bacterium]|nr:MAG: hypothetical protein EA381_02705 [Planctomycetaceae bacterium]
MIDPALLQLIRCPIDGQVLTVGSEELTRELNRRIESRQLRDRADGLVDDKLESVLVTADHHRAYPVRDRIPTLIPSEAIELGEDFPGGPCEPA